MLLCYIIKVLAFSSAVIVLIMCWSSSFHLPHILSYNTVAFRYRGTSFVSTPIKSQI